MSMSIIEASIVLEKSIPGAVDIETIREAEDIALKTTYAWEDLKQMIEEAILGLSASSLPEAEWKCDGFECCLQYMKNLEEEIENGN